MGQRRGRDISGILLLDKAAGASSNQALQTAKRLYQAAKAGHTGNLDVPAEGLLPICFGEATKLCAYLLDADKRYRAEITLGVATTTGDAEGRITRTGEVAGIDRARVERAVEAFRGEIEQLPPMHSALKYHGERLYRLARRGIEVPRQTRRVVIHAIAVTHVEGARVGLDVHCSKGTYIRALADDIGQALGCGAHLSRLRRLSVGPFDVARAYTMEALREKAASGAGALDALLEPMDVALPRAPRIDLTGDACYYLRHGQPVQVPRAPTRGIVRLYDPAARFVGIGEVQDDGRIAPRRLLRI
jgi:tRNA pseudouridine55 synthase